ncbi:store-operated calcium entry-associated regulatory factor-like [Oculina patagonica]
MFGMASVITFGTLRTFILFGSLFIVPVLGWGSSDKIQLTDVRVITLLHGRMTNSRRTHPVPQLKCVGWSAGCLAFTPSVVHCYNRGLGGLDGYDLQVQWECKTDMDSEYRFGEIAVNCEGYDYPNDSYVLEGSCGVCTVN